VRRAFAGVGVAGGAIQSTARPGDEALLTRRAIDDGATTIVAVGGDGTWSNVANAVLRSGADCRLALVAAGTCNDFAKSAGVPATDYAAMARLSVEGTDRRVDVGRVEDGWFLNAVGFGFDVAVLEKAATVRWLRGRLLYVYAALHQLLSYRASRVAIATADEPGAAAARLIVVVANGRRFGGVFQIAPNASCTDGMLDSVAIPDAAPLERLRLLARAIRGRHAGARGVEMLLAPAFTLRFDDPPAYEVDGERRQARASTLEVRCASAALRVVGALTGEPG
jgi:diacylglycerol kinase (ATP)